MNRLLAIVLCVLFFVACGEDPDADPRFVRLAITSNPQALDPATATDVNGGDVCAKIYNGLVRFEGLGVTADLAETWTISPDGLEYVFLLRQGVRFHNGREATSADFLYSFDRIRNPASGSKRAWVLEATDTFLAPSPFRFVIRLKQPSAAFISLLAMPACYVVPREEVERWGEDFTRHPCGTGPFRFERWEDDRSVRLLRNDDYFAGAPAIEGLVYRVIPEPLTQMALLRQGALDICEIPDAQIPAFASDPEWKDRIQTVDQLVTVYVAVNTERFPDPETRKALNMAVDASQIIRSIRNGLATRADGPVPPGLMPGVVPGHTFDPERAKRTLTERGFDFGRELVLLRNAPRAALEPAEAVAGYLRDAGLKVTVEPMEFSALRARVNKGDYDLCILNWYADYADAENFLLPLFHSKNVGSAGNRSRLADAEVDSSLDRIGSAWRPEERQEALMKAVSLIIEEAPWIFLWHPRTAVAVAPRLSGYTVPAIFNGDKGTTYRIEP